MCLSQINILKSLILPATEFGPDSYLEVLTMMEYALTMSKSKENQDRDFIWKGGFSGVTRMDSHKHLVRLLSLKRRGLSRQTGK